MIIKGQAWGRAKQLARHLLRADQNETIQLLECRGTLAQDVEGALIEMEARGKAARTERPLYHASISPEAATPLKGVQITQAVDHLEERLGLHGQPRIVVVHRKKDREHIHVVWSRVSSQRTRGKPGSRRTTKDHELRQSERSGMLPSSVSRDITALWFASGDSAEFRRKLEEAGYTLARGDRRVFVVIDRMGGVHSLARRADGVNTSMVRSKLRDISLNDLPSVSDVRERITLAARAVIPRKFASAAREVARPGFRLPQHAMASQSRKTYGTCKPRARKGERLRLCGANTLARVRQAKCRLSQYAEWRRPQSRLHD